MAIYKSNGFIKMTHLIAFAVLCCNVQSLPINETTNNTRLNITTTQNPGKEVIIKGVFRIIKSFLKECTFFQEYSPPGSLGAVL